MRLLLATAAVTGLVASSAQAAAVPEVISEPRDEITGLFSFVGSLSWTWRDGNRTGSSELPFGGSEIARPAGLIDRPFDTGRSTRQAAYSHGGRLMLLRGGTRTVIAKRRKGLADERFDAGLGVLVWTERHRRLYASTTRKPIDTEPSFRPYSKPTLLATGRIRAVALGNGVGLQYAATGGVRSAVAWQDARNRIRVRLLVRGPRFRAPVTIARADGRVNALHVNYSKTGAVAVSVLWSTASGVRVAVRDAGGRRFGKPVKLSSHPASGIVPEVRRQFLMYGQPGGIRLYASCAHGIVDRLVRSVTGTPHVDDVDVGLDDVAYTLNGSTYFNAMRLGAGHDARIGPVADADGDGVGEASYAWIRGAEVVRRTIDQPLALRTLRGGSPNPSPCDA